MGRAWNPETKHYDPACDEIVMEQRGYVVIEAPGRETITTPNCEPRYWTFLNGSIVEMTADEKAVIDNPPESMADRHAREQREGVTLANGWVMKWTDIDQNKMNLTKSRADLCERDQVAGPCVPFFEANGTPHMVGHAEAFVVLRDYSDKVMAEQFRQWQEAANG